MDPLIEKLFDLSQLKNADIFTQKTIFEYLQNMDWLTDFLQKLGVADEPVIYGEVSASAYVSGAVYIAQGAKVEPTAYIAGPCYIGEGTEVRHGAYLRGNVYAGEKCVLGHATEVKSSIFFDGAKAGHFAYVGNSVLGREVNLGAGTKLANLRLDKKSVPYVDPLTRNRADSGLKKFGALVGDYAQTGCNSVLNPGTILLKGALVKPCNAALGLIGER